MRINLKKELVKIFSSLLVVTFSVYIAISEGANLLSLDTNVLHGDTVEIKLEFDEPMSVPDGFILEDLAQIALNFMGAKSNLANAQSQFTFDTGSVRTVRILEMNNQMRIHIDLLSSKPYSTYTEGNYVYVIIGERAINSPISSVQTANSIEQKQIVKQVYGNRAITNIDFKLGDISDVRNNGDAKNNKKGNDNVGNVIIELSDSKISPIIKDQPNKILLDFANTQIPEDLRLRLDVTDFNTAVRYVSALNGNNKSTITIDLEGNYDHVIYQAGNKLVLSVRKLQGDEETYKGNKVTFDFKNIEIRDALTLLVSEAKDKHGNVLKNLVVSESVSGSVLLKLEGVPWDHAFKIITEIKGLDFREDGNLLIVAPANEISDYYQSIADSRKKIRDLAPLKKEIIPLSYAQASDIVSLYENTIRNTDEIGTLATDERTNSIIANKTQAQLKELHDLIAKLDIPLKQVMIEVRVVSVAESLGSSLGIKWLGGAIHGKKYIGSKGADIKSKEVDAGDIVTLPEETNMAGWSYGLTVGHITQSSILALRINALKADNKVEVISQPKVIASDRTTATVSIGKKIPYQESAANGGTTTKYEDAVVSLDVTPQITPDNSVILKTAISNDEALDSQPGEAPSIRKQELNAEVLVRDGETIVLGGLFTNNQNISDYRIPVLGDIPFIGRLFRSSTSINTKTEVLIFITPRIIHNRPIAQN